MSEAARARMAATMTHEELENFLVFADTRLSAEAEEAILGRDASLRAEIERLRAALAVARDPDFPAPEGRRTPDRLSDGPTPGNASDGGSGAPRTAPRPPFYGPE